MRLNHLILCQQVQGLLNLLVETGTLKMFEVKTGKHTGDRDLDDSVRIEDGILSRFPRGIPSLPCDFLSTVLYACVSCASTNTTATTFYLFVDVGPGRT